MATEREPNQDIIIGMKRALNAMENCDGDLDFAIFVVKRDVEKLSKESESKETL